MASLVVEKASTNYPVTRDEAKNYARETIDDNDSLFDILVAAATDAVEIFTGRSLCFKGYRQSLDAFPYFADSAVSQQAYPAAYYSLPLYSTTFWNYSQQIKLFRSPVVSVDRISFLSAGDSQWHDLVPVPNLWYPGKSYALNAMVMDGNGNVQKCTAPGKSNANPPVWSKLINVTTTEVNPDPAAEGSGVAWQNIGPFSDPNTQGRFGSYISDTDSEPARVFPGGPGSTWPPVLYVPNAVQLHYTSGYSADGALVPAIFKTAILMTVNTWFEHRETIMPGQWTQLPGHIQTLLWSKRIVDFSPTRG